jgi:hypothetical protein
MQADNLSRALLVLILVCLLFLLGQGRGGGSAEVAAPASGAERFSVRLVKLQRGPPLLLRTDTATGQAWTMGLMAAGHWQPLREAADGIPAEGAVQAGRYHVMAVAQQAGPPTLVRSDQLTGRVWRKGATSKGAWVAVPNPGETPPQKAAAAGEEPAGSAEAAEAP